MRSTRFSTQQDRVHSTVYCYYSRGGRKRREQLRLLYSLSKRDFAKHRRITFRNMVPRTVKMKISKVRKIVFHINAIKYDKYRETPRQHLFLQLLRLINPRDLLTLMIL